ncbi:hypothetical protein OA39_02900 [Vibrio campbellii]|uniref:DUF4422 domain-containing protein n=1 Tax=Vibrio campbellii TaxID=680 RepID=UPI000530F7AB|nr:DUF4422 domain-containing protein [Vibrio campbellii]KGR34530.1 hypothetical protein OA39_02900 [Vibrio campbellii]
MSVYIVSHIEVTTELAEHESMLYGGDYRKRDEEFLLSITHDHFANSIAHKNKYYSELTSLYAINQVCQFEDLSYSGLMHYRRRFSQIPSSAFSRGKLFKKIYFYLIHKKGLYLTKSKIEESLTEFDAILPQKVKFPCSMYEQFAKHHDVSDLLYARAALEKLFPDYLPAYDTYMASRDSHLFNMLIAKKEIINDYCNWIFPILDELEKTIDLDAKHGYQQRCMGYIAERLINVYFLKNSQIRTKEYLVVADKDSDPRKVYVGI